MMPLSVPGLDCAVIRHDDPHAAAVEDHVTAFLPDEDEPGTLQCGTHPAAGQGGRELGHRQAASTSTNSLPASVGTGSPASRSVST